MEDCMRCVSLVESGYAKTPTKQVCLHLFAQNWTLIWRRFEYQTVIWTKELANKLQLELGYNSVVALTVDGKYIQQSTLILYNFIFVMMQI